MAQGTYAEIDDLQIPDDLALCSASDVDDRGIPLIFSKFALCRGMSGVKGGSRDSSCDRVSIPETVDYGTDLETLKGPVDSLFDSDGFPAVLGVQTLLAPIESAKSASSADVLSVPLDPCPKRRKKDVLASRANPDLVTPSKVPKAKAKATPEKVAEAKAKAKAKAKAIPAKVAEAKADVIVGNNSDLVLFDPKLTVTSEEDPPPCSTNCFCPV